MYIAHKRQDGAEQPLRDHLMNTAELAERFADSFGQGPHGKKVGLLHDKGKYGANSQKRMKDPEHVAKTPHAYAGAQTASHEKDLAGVYAIAGHHGGLMDNQTLLNGKLKQKSEDCSAFDREISYQHGNLMPGYLSRILDEKDAFACSFYIRMLFSCLVDADFLDTERFMNEEETQRGGGDSMEALLAKLENDTEKWFPPRGEINEKRCEILKDCAEAGDGERGLYTLTVPTGGGKTISSLMFALRHAVKHHMDRVIYVVPYTSIIEQNAAEFEKRLGAENVLEHHSGVDYEENGNEEENGWMLRRKLATENWDKPIIVTTAVQFFESLFAARTSRCRKLHNIANSVIIFDEAQMMPMDYLRPCVYAIAELVRHYRATAVLCTATQPALDALFHKYAPEMDAREIVRNRDELYEFFRRVRYVQEGKLSEEELCMQLGEEEQVLCIVNTRKRAQRLFEALPEEGRFHLSTLMTPADRRSVLDEVRKRLKNGQTCRVVSTSLIEAGVDVDFPTVWREEAGIDSILQAGGRCNREGKRNPAESVVHVFVCEGNVPRLFQRQVQAMQLAVETTQMLEGLQTIRCYSQEMIREKGNGIDLKGIIQECESLNFKSIEDAFRLIETQTKCIYIPNEENLDLLDALRKGYYTQRTLRLLQKDGVNVYKDYADDLMGAGKLELTQDGFLILADAGCYDSERGLSIESDPGAALFI